VSSDSETEEIEVKLENRTNLRSNSVTVVVHELPDTVREQVSSDRSDGEGLQRGRRGGRREGRRNGV